MEERRQTEAAKVLPNDPGERLGEGDLIEASLSLLADFAEGSINLPSSDLALRSKVRSSPNWVEKKSVPPCCNRWLSDSAHSEALVVRPFQGI